MDPASAVISVVPHYPHDPWVHLLARASIYLSHVIKSCQGPGWLRSWGTESWDMGHPVSYDHHTLGPNMRPSHWLMATDLGSDWSLARISGKAWSRHKHKESQEIQQTLWTVDSGTGEWHGPVMTMRGQTSWCARAASGQGGIAKTCKNCNHISRRSSGVRS